jgi:hypothetical protein
MSEARAGRPLASIQLYDAVDELNQVVAGFVDRYNSSWLIPRHGHHTQGGLPGQHNRDQHHDRIDHESVQETGCRPPSGIRRYQCGHIERRPSRSGGRTQIPLATSHPLPVRRRLPWTEGDELAVSGPLGTALGPPAKPLSVHSGHCAQPTRQPDPIPLLDLQ